MTLTTTNIGGLRTLCCICNIG